MTELQMTLVFALAAVMVFLVIWRSFRAWNDHASTPFQMVDLFMENGRASKGSVVLLGAFAATTWFFVYYTMTGRMTEGYFGLYSAAWIAPIVVRILSTSTPPEAKP